MTTNIQSTDLDFSSIKESLKTYFLQSNEFSDYDFEASGLSNLLDVLAHNTHYNGLFANVALNESFLQTAQLRSSIVTHAQSLGYTPYSKTSAFANLNVSLSVTDPADRSAIITIPKDTLFTSSIEGKNYVFQTTEAFSAYDDGFGQYTFLDAHDNEYIQVYEGSLRTKTFYVGEVSERTTYVIPDSNLDTTTLSVKVYDTAGSSNYTVYTDIASSITVDADSTYYVLKESPNGNYELSFSDGVILGQTPIAGNKIVVEYISSNGEDGNGAITFSTTASYTVNTNTYQYGITTINKSSGGSEKQSIESIRQLAPLNHASQQRLVTSQDYKTLILSNYASLEDAIAWGGEENVPPEYGKAFVSLKFPDGTDDTSKTALKSKIKTELLDVLSVMSITPEFVDPDETYIIFETSFDFNPNLTSITAQTMQANVLSLISDHVTSNLEKFGKSFRRSRLLTEIDELDDAILSSKVDIKVQQRFTPTLGLSTSYVINFPVTLAQSDDVNYVITSSRFVYSGHVSTIQNKLNSNKLQIVSATGTVLIDNIGTYDSGAGKVTLVGFNPSSILEGKSYIKINAVPLSQSVVKPLRNYILDYENELSYANATVDYQTIRTTL